MGRHQRGLKKINKLGPLILAVLLAGGTYLADLSGVVDLSLPAAGARRMELKEVTDVPQKLKETKREGIASNRYADVYVVDVIDGDTLEVTYDGKSHKVRLLCIDTPESVKPGTPVQVYSKEASRYTRELVLNKSVRLVFEKGLRDRYGRLLAHVLLKDGSYLNALLVRNGFARVEIVSPNKTYEDYFCRLQDAAINEKTGIWGLPSDKKPFLKNEKGNYVPRYLLEKEAS